MADLRGRCATLLAKIAPGDEQVAAVRVAVALRHALEDLRGELGKEALPLDGAERARVLGEEDVGRRVVALLEQRIQELRVLAGGARADDVGDIRERDHAESRMLGEQSGAVDLTLPGHPEVHVVGERGGPRVDLQDLEAVHRRRQRHLDDAVEAARAAHGGVEHVLAVRRRHPDDALAAGHAVHLDEELVERDLLFTRAVGAPAAAAERVELVDEDDAGGRRTRLLHQVADPPGAHAHVHLGELGAGRQDHRPAGLPGDGAGEVSAVDHWGRRQLAYPIEDRENGYYVVVHANTPADRLPEFERLLQLDEGLLRYLIVINEAGLSTSPAPIGEAGDDEDGSDDEEV